MPAYGMTMVTARETPWFPRLGLTTRLWASLHSTLPRTSCAVLLLAASGLCGACACFLRRPGCLCCRAWSAVSSRRPVRRFSTHCRALWTGRTAQMTSMLRFCGSIRAVRHLHALRWLAQARLHCSGW
jgi:hypothetical protein